MFHTKCFAVATKKEHIAVKQVHYQSHLTMFFPVFVPIKPPNVIIGVRQAK